MIRKLSLVAAVGALAVPPLARAEEASPPRVGVGVGVNLGNVFSGGSLAASPVDVFVPINVTDSFRLEPSFGYWYVGRGITVSGLNGASTSTGGYAVEAALGGFYLLRPTPPFTVYLGGRVGVAFIGHSSQDVAGVVTSVSETDMYVNPTLGLEWAVSRNFSVGGEAAPAFRFYFNPTVTVGNVSTNVSGSKFGTGFDAVLLMRLYL
ncbi:MAG TPA: outer membrane beta-barrel protein [Anaeromyxobacteraceae bacterium]|nr:outer membrane beta-barrel protein [Anaeromyxobacteraceae bacterium]